MSNKYTPGQVVDTLLLAQRHGLLDSRDSEIYSPEASDGEPGVLRRIWLRLFGGKDRRVISQRERDWESGKIN